MRSGASGALEHVCDRADELQYRQHYVDLQKRCEEFARAVYGLQRSNEVSK